MTTTQNIHGHEVLHLILEANPPLTRAALEAEASSRWGSEARFCTCSAFGMTLAELLGFLIARGKVVETAGRLEVQLANICSHGGHHHEH